jgi:hypothetical protein
MKKFFETISVNLDRELNKIRQENHPLLKECEASVFIIYQSLQKMRRHIIQNPFADQAEEIHFFKVIKPGIYSQLIYNVELYNIESNISFWSKADSKAEIECHINRIKHYRQKNKEFFQYLRNDLTAFDSRYFVRNKLNLCDCLEAFSFDADPNFTTGMDYKVARFKANELLLEYLNEKLFSLTEDEMIPPTSIQSIRWTESKIALTELIYALHAAGCINKGNIEIKAVARYFQQALNIQLGDFYRDFNQIKNRSKSTKFIDQLKNSICDKIKSR